MHCSTADGGEEGWKGIRVLPTQRRLRRGMSRPRESRVKCVPVELAAHPNLLNLIFLKIKYSVLIWSVGASGLEWDPMEDLTILIPFGLRTT